MAPTDGQDEQSRNRWPLNDAPGLSADDPRLTQDGAADESGETRVLERAGARAEPAAKLPGEVDFSTYVNEELNRRWSGTGDAKPRRPASTSIADRTDEEERARFARVGYGGLYRSGQFAPEAEAEAPSQFDDSVLGLNYATVAPRVSVTDERWAASLRSFARGAVWCLPVGALLLALSAVFGWPTATSEPALVSPGAWVVVTALGLGLWLLGVIALAALAMNSRVRYWGFAAVIASTLGVALFAPVVGAVGLGRPAISRAATATDDARIADLAAQMQGRLLDHTVGRSLVIAGGVLLLLGAIAVAGLILGSRVLQRHDGWLVLLGVAIAIVATFLSWEFLFVLAAMAALAGALGLAYTVSRIAPDGTAPSAY